MPATYTILYPCSAKLDIDHYVNHHMPMAFELFRPSILQSWTVFKFPEDAPYSIQADVTWASVEACDEALASEKGQLLAKELKKCSKGKPVVMFRTLIKRKET